MEFKIIRTAAVGDEHRGVQAHEEEVLHYLSCGWDLLSSHVVVHHTPHKTVEVYITYVKKLGYLEIG